MEVLKTSDNNWLFTFLRVWRFYILINVKPNIQDRLLELELQAKSDELKVKSEQLAEVDKDRFTASMEILCLKKALEGKDELIAELRARPEAHQSPGPISDPNVQIWMSSQPPEEDA